MFLSFVSDEMKIMGLCPSHGSAIISPVNKFLPRRFFSASEISHSVKEVLEISQCVTETVTLNFSLNALYYCVTAEKNTLPSVL